MDLDTTLAFSLAVVFAYVSAPPLLGDWLSDVVQVESMSRPPYGIGIPFGLTLQLDGRDWDCTGELIAYEPPAVVAYRFFAGPRTFVLRLTCAASGNGTRLRIRHASAGPLAVDVGRLEEALARRRISDPTAREDELAVRLDEWS